MIDQIRYTGAGELREKRLRTGYIRDASATRLLLRPRGAHAECAAPGALGQTQ